MAGPRARVVVVNRDPRVARPVGSFAFNGPARVGAWRNTSRSVREDSLWPASSEPVNSLQHYLHTYGTVLRVLNFVLLHDSTPEGGGVAPRTLQSPLVAKSRRCVVSLHATSCRLASGISTWRLM